MVTGDCPSLDLSREKQLQETVLELIRRGWVQSAHDVSDGGLAVALAESCLIDFENPRGARVQLQANGLRPEWLLFSESQSRVVISIRPKDQSDVEQFLQDQQIPFTLLGTVGGERFRINDWIDLPLEELRDIYYHTIERLME